MILNITGVTRYPKVVNGMYWLGLVVRYFRSPKRASAAISYV